MAGQLGLNLKNGERVRIENTNSHLDSRRGIVIGKSFSDGVCSAYIVMLDTPLEGEVVSGISMIESCLTRDHKPH